MTEAPPAQLSADDIITRLALGDYQFEDEAFGEFVRRQLP